MSQCSLNRYLHYLLYLLYLQCQVYFTTATGAVRSAADLTNLFYTSYHEHSYRVVEVIAQEISSATQEVDTECSLSTVLQLETKVIRMFPKISQSRRRPLLGPSPG